MASEFETATIFNSINGIRDAFNFILEPPRVFAFHTAGTALTDGAWTLVSLGGELYDPYSTAGHDLVTNNSRVFARETGIYNINCAVRTTDLSATIFQFQVRLNSAGSDTGGTRVLLTSQNGAGGAQVSEDGRSIEWPMTVNDYVELFVRVDTGANPNASLTPGADSTFLSIFFKSKQ